ncbi:hypothetical protein [Geobacter sp. AOG2]|uniref:hypothetical protein n=1 Tax=Geobacter sp. AOG2 TaxID=1566347 RepID=UPI001CC34F0E|nr:hypothetical protein [Geobacter sp. AOG2]GFE60598.1 hypothetical protein AOG2_11860 [Geobacter sp. AOG2]
MKVPFRQQTSDYDCVPTTIINALSYLFDRREIPPFIVRQIYKECLDIKAYRGTSSRAIQDLGFWLSHYKEKNFNNFVIESEFITGNQVHFQQQSKIVRCINSNGAALLCVQLNRDTWHYILGLRFEEGWLYCYDPLPRSKRFIGTDAVQFISATGQAPNLRIHLDWLDKKIKKIINADEYKYVLGCTNERECLLLRKISV